MASRVPTEEFYGAPTDVNQPMIASQNSPSEEAYRQSQSNNRNYHAEGSDIRQKMIASKVKSEEDFANAYAPAIQNLAGNYYQGKGMANQAEEQNQRIAQTERTAKRDQTYGDEMARLQLEQGRTSIASTQAGTASTNASTSRVAQLTPGEVTQQGQQIAAQPLHTQALASSIRGTNLQNETLDTQNKAATIAAILGNASQGAQNPMQAEQMKQQKLQELQQNGHYDGAILAKGARLATENHFQDSSMRNFVLQNDPQYQKAQAVRQRLEASANVMVGLKSELSKLEQNSDLFDSPAQKQAVENLANQLASAGQEKLAASLRQNMLEAMTTPGSPTTKVARAKAAVAAVSRSIQNEVGLATQMSQNNPHLSPQSLQPLLQAVSYDPNQASVAPDIFKSLNRGAVGGGFQNTAAPSPAMSFQQQMPQQQPPIDLFGGPGSVRKQMPAAPQKGR